MLKIAICEDESYMLEELKARLQRYLAQRGSRAALFCFSSAEQLVLSGECFDIVLMDIKLPGMDGMEAVRRLRAKGADSQVVFITSCRAYVFEAFEVDAVHYLLKPVTDKDLSRALDKAVKRTGRGDNRALTIARGAAVQVVRLRDILYGEAADHKIYIHTATDSIDYYGKLDALQNQLDDRFFRCHRSYIVNLAYVCGKERDLALLTNGEKILVSRRKQQEFTQRLLSCIREEAL